MIIAVDYDGTLEIKGDMNIALIQRLKMSQKQGNIIILWTCREGKRLHEAIIKLKQCGFIPSIVNENAPQTIKALGYSPRKILADVYIDDKNA